MSTTRSRTRIHPEESQFIKNINKIIRLKRIVKKLKGYAQKKQLERAKEGDDTTLYNEDVDSIVFSKARSIDFTSLLKISNELKQKYSFKQVKDFPTFFKFIKSKGFTLTENEIKHIYNNIFNTPEDRLSHLSVSQQKLADIASVGRHSIRVVDTVENKNEALTHILRYAITAPKPIFDETSLVQLPEGKYKESISDTNSNKDGKPFTTISTGLTTSIILKQAVYSYWEKIDSGIIPEVENTPIIIVLSTLSGHTGHSSVMFLLNGEVWSVAVGYFGISEQNAKIHHEKVQNWGEDKAGFIHISDGVLYTPDSITSLARTTLEGTPYRYYINDMRVATKTDISKMDSILQRSTKITYIPFSDNRRESYNVNINIPYSTLSRTCSNTVNCATFASNFTDNLRIMFTRFAKPSSYCPFTTDQINLIFKYIINKPLITSVNKDEYTSVLTLLKGTTTSEVPSIFSLFSKGGKKSRRPKHTQKRKTYKKV